MTTTLRLSFLAWSLMRFNWPDWLTATLPLVTVEQVVGLLLDQQPVVFRVRGVTSARSETGDLGEETMAVHVRVRDRDSLRERVEAVGSYADVAFRAGLSPSRLSQVLSGTAPVIKLENGVLLEKALEVPPGTYFLLDNPPTDAELVAAYLQVAVPAPAEPVDDRAVPAERGEG